MTILKTNMARRSVLRAGTAGAAALAFGGTAAKADSNQVIVYVGTGDWAESNIKAFVRPFEEETGIEVIEVEDWYNLNQVRLWVETGTVQADVLNIGGSQVDIMANEGLLEEIDYSIYSDATKNDIVPESQHKFGVGALFYSTVLSYWADQFTDQPPPSGWQQFWDVDGFPGKRTLVSGEGGYGSWEIALIADGVPMDQLYPLDIERAFDSLDRIRPHITKWWLDGSDNQQIFADRFVDLGAAYNGRMGNLQKQDLPIVIDWNEGKLEQDFWGIPKGAPNPENAQKFIEFASRGAQQAIFSQEIPYAPTNLSAFDYIPEDVAVQLPTYPENLAKQFTRNYAWEAEVIDGKSNLERLIEAWNRFIIS